MLRFLLFLLALAVPASAQETMIREVFDPGTDTHVEITALFTKPAPGGYLPVRVKIANNQKRDHSVHLNFDSSEAYSSDLHTRTTFDLGAAAGKTVTTDILVPINPPAGTYGNMVSLGLTMAGSLGESGYSIQSNFKPNQPAVLLSEALFTPNASTLDSEINSKFSSSYGGNSEFAGKFDPKQLPDDWRAFSGYDSVIMTDGDWTNVPPGGRNAILSWVRLGGQLLIFSASPGSAEALGLPSGAGYGEIHLVPYTPAGSFDAKDLVKRVTLSSNKPLQQSAINDYRSGWPLQQAFGTKTFRYSLFVAVLVIFGILVGPINLFVFAKSGQRHKLFITTPLISLGASLVLIVIIILQDGFGGNGIRRVLMEVRPDAGINAAFVHQEQFSRTGVLTGSEFTLSTPAVFNPVPIPESRWARFTDGNGAKGNFNLQAVDGKLKASGDWFQSRSEHGHILSAVISTRGRIEKTDAANTFLSTFDYPLQTLYYLDAANEWHRADGIQAGKRFTLTPVDSSMAITDLIKQAAAFAERDSNQLKTAITRPGHFVAITKDAPGIETHPGIRWKETVTVITGPVM